jgi:hypothetical protein
MQTNNPQEPSIPDVPEQIFDSSSKGRLVIFIGAGVSRIIGCPSWEEFANYLLDDLHKKGKINFFEKTELSKLHARKILSVCCEIFKESNIQFPDLKEFFRGDQDLEARYKIFENLYAMNAIYVTTNYDDHLDEEAERRRPLANAYFSKNEPNGKTDSKIKRAEVFWREKDLLISNLSNGNVIHIHGSIKEPETMVITLADYMHRYYGEASRLRIFLQELFGHYTVIFIGYGLEEYEILEFMIRTIRKGQKSVSHYILLPFFKSQKNLVNLQEKYYQCMGMKLIAYYVDDPGYVQLNEVIKEWAKQIGPLARAQTFLDKLRLIDEVL